jgi:redox-sensitive bicupin YhaK (pirin superfamily)
MISTIRNSERGHSQYSWLDSWHTFSFGDYYDPHNKGVSVLRVINEDTVMPNSGFETHSHRDMEIISYILEGAIEHQDSMGNITRLEAGDFQVMTAGTGITHSEYNPSNTDPLHFLQIWIRPGAKGLKPTYRQRGFPLVTGRQTIVSPDGAGGSLHINQDATVERVRLAAGDETKVKVAGDRSAYLHMVYGEMQLNDTIMQGGDGAVISASSVRLRGNGDAEALLFSLP